MSANNRYDSVSYPGLAYPDSHIAHLFGLAAWWGLAAAPPEACRVLEIACGDGANLIPMALELPHSRFVGVDLAQEPIARGQSLAAELDLRNLQLHAQDFQTLHEEAGSFDYILVHGLYSWVDAPLREALMRRLARLLSPRGLAFVSYNCYPGCHRRAEVWESLRFHVEGITDPAQRVTEARSLAQLLRQSQLQPDLQGQAMQAELDRLLRSPPGVLFHDDLAETNQPFYFHQFNQHAQQHGLQFLGEAELAAMGTQGLSPLARQTLQALDPLSREQYRDFMRQRRFRQTLLCHAEQSLQREPQPEHLLGFHLSSDAKLQGDRDSLIAHSESACLHELIEWLTAASPNSLPVPDLLQRLLQAHGGHQSEAQLLRLMHSALMTGVVRLHARPLRLCTQASSQPMASALARAQLRRDPQADLLTTLRHDMLKIEDPLVRRLLTLMDGSRNRPQLLQAMSEASTQDPSANQATEITSLEALEAHLHTLGRMALLSD
ncbi:class I SAM-dependent methyltransferase [Paucibacter sp. AS339]|uniref:class I SAM-dependent methyltransferase n=1 Tax=Paucibacter hankyongi TaxID=3133434 RepID=UPI0030A7E7B0